MSFNVIDALYTDANEEAYVDANVDNEQSNILPLDEVIQRNLEILEEQGEERSSIDVYHDSEIILNMKDLSRDYINSTEFERKYFKDIPFKNIDGTITYNYAFLKDIKYKDFIGKLKSVIQKDFCIEKFLIIPNSENNKELEEYLSELIGCSPENIVMRDFINYLSDFIGYQNIRFYIAPRYQYQYEYRSHQQEADWLNGY